MIDVAGGEGATLKTGPRPRVPSHQCNDYITVTLQNEGPMEIDNAPPLSPVASTLFLTLQARAHETLQPKRLINDPEAVRILQAFRQALPLSRRSSSTHAGIISRSSIYDAEVRRLLALGSRPVVNLGAGLCTRFYRLGRPDVDWAEVDFPDVIALRQTLLPASGRHRMLAGSVTDYAWMDQISPEPGVRPLFIAEGLLWYISDDEIKRLLIQLNRRFPGSRMLVDVPTTILSALFRWSPAMRIPGILLHGGTIGSQRLLNRWSHGITLEKQWRQYEGQSGAWGRMALLQYVPGMRDWGKVVSLRFDGTPPTGQPSPRSSSCLRPYRSGSGRLSGMLSRITALRMSTRMAATIAS